MIDASQTFHAIEALILSGVAHSSPASPKWRQISDLEAALELATGQCLDGFEDWNDLRELQSSITLAKSYDVDGGSTAIRAISDLATKFTLCGLNGLVENEISADLESCAQARVFDSPASAFFETLVSAYSSGYWPCGWKGVYPQGTLCVFPLRDAVRT